MSSEQPVEAFPVRGGEMVVSFQQTKPGAEQVRFVGRFHTGRLAALQFPAYQGQSLGEPSDGVEAVQDMTGSGKITMNSCPVGVGTVGDHSLHTVAPSGLSNRLCEGLGSWVFSGLGSFG